MNSPEAQELEYTRPIEAAPATEPVAESPTPSSPPSSPAPPHQAPPVEPPPAPLPSTPVDEHPSAAYAVPTDHYQPAVERQENVLYVPLAITVGDGFKLGCGFFMAFVVAMLIGFVILAALFALTSVMGINLPVGR